MGCRGVPLRAGGDGDTQAAVPRAGPGRSSSPGAPRSPARGSSWFAQSTEEQRALCPRMRCGQERWSCSTGGVSKPGWAKKPCGCQPEHKGGGIAGTRGAQGLKWAPGSSDIRMKRLEFEVCAPLLPAPRAIPSFGILQQEGGRRQPTGNRFALSFFLSRLTDPALAEVFSDHNHLIAWGKHFLAVTSAPVLARRVFPGTAHCGPQGGPATAGMAQALPGGFHLHWCPGRPWRGRILSPTLRLARLPGKSSVARKVLGAAQPWLSHRVQPG